MGGDGCLNFRGKWAVKKGRTGMTSTPRPRQAVRARLPPSRPAVVLHCCRRRAFAFNCGGPHHSADIAEISLRITLPAHYTPAEPDACSAATMRMTERPDSMTLA